MALLYEKESNLLLGLAMKLHRELGCGFKEKVYQDAFEVLLNECQVPYSREQHIGLTYHGVLLQHDFFYDFLCFEKIGIEIKALESLDGISESQLINYLHVSNHQLGLLLNFGTTSLEYKWIPNQWHHRSSSSIG
ncbi:MAG: GxxExxY protein [Bacteroidales bacterium]|nr:GxxExxY protein [Bacteroidales bacterium]